MCIIFFFIQSAVCLCRLVVLIIFLYDHNVYLHKFLFVFVFLYCNGENFFLFEYYRLLFFNNLISVVFHTSAAIYSLQNYIQLAHIPYIVAVFQSPFSPPIPFRPDRHPADQSRCSKKYVFLFSVLGYRLQCLRYRSNLATILTDKVLMRSLGLCARKCAAAATSGWNI